MDVYVFQAALICDTCGTLYKQGTDKPAHVDESDESSYDSDDWPKGPYSDGGGEADGPCHCDHCGVFLDNPLTPDGETYVRDAFREYVETGRGRLDVLAEWKAAYDWVWSDFESITLEGMREEGLTDLCERRAASLEAA
jgi:hypothetical protein